ALAVWIALDAVALTAGQVRRLSVVALVAIAAKVGWGMFSPHLLSGSPGIAVAETSHAAAVVFAAAAWIVLRLRPVRLTARPAGMA
ncbi:MAG TPA: hypothetical protein VHM67_03040, partial [Gemmatimonadaceae bacterium]|nr:hypothetical protein [Gemmatimonadaceae bacterium]